MVILAGPPGSGKSTLRDTIIAYRKFLPEDFVDTDEMTKRLFGVYNKENWKKAQARANELKDQKIANGEPLGFETIFGSIRGIDFIRKAKSENYIVDVFYVTTDSPEKCIERVGQRAKEGGHSQTPEDIRALYHLSAQNYIEAVKIADQTLFYDNSRDFEAPMLLLTTKHGILNYMSPDFPEWAKSLKEAISFPAKPSAPIEGLDFSI